MHTKENITPDFCQLTVGVDGVGGRGETSSILIEIILK